MKFKLEIDCEGIEGGGQAILDTVALQLGYAKQSLEQPRAALAIGDTCGCYSEAGREIGHYGFTS